ncbi:hypothetical protein [Phytoactinopolyspora mesophila]|uniref:Uncharacterized protein n=1 Tax=Phytoactinopolyspora mesophila TaxID=2650750 RepID=A0A7K3M6K7_9ACTN|nr:hypothetical protein [Phytoactinopolyspora mesophila]NDL58939.1 hypothetical protein [Phytoactinopolyspora mesophila]
MPAKARGDFSDSSGKLVGGLDKSPVDDLAEAAGYDPGYTPSSRSYGGSGSSGGSGSGSGSTGDSSGGSGRHRNSIDDDAATDTTDSSGDAGSDDDADDDSEFSGEADTDEDTEDVDSDDAEDDPQSEDEPGDDGSDDTHGEHSQPEDDHHTGNDNDDDTSHHGRVSIDIQAMTALIAAMERARDQIPEFEAELRKILSDVELIEFRIPEARGLGAVIAWIEEELPGLRRRLALAQAIENGEFRIEPDAPRQPRRPVAYPEDRVPDHQPYVSRERGQESAVLFTAQSADPKAEDLIAKLKGNEHDPYFAHAFTNDADPRAVAETVEAARRSDPAKAEELNSLLESTVQTAGRGTGELAPEDDFGDQWSQFADDAPPAAAPA